MPSYTKDNFFGGLKNLPDTSKLETSEYFLLINGRVRENAVKPVNLPLDITPSTPEGIYQALYGFGDFLLLLVSGQAYYKSFVPAAEEGFTAIPGLLLDATVDRLYVQGVPSSAINFKRERVTATDTKEINLTVPTSGAPACAIVQDGINQPWLIFPDASSRLASNYAQWDKDNNREYIPIGKQMLYHSGILYLIGKDTSGRWTQIFRSVTGRPTDFMVNIDENGDRGHPTEEDLGGAPSVAHAVDFNEITALANINTPDGSFYIGTENSSYLVIPDTSTLIFGEPKFGNQFLFSTGPVNHVSIAETLGDVSLIDVNGLRKFNAVLQTKNEGKNTIFSRSIFNLIRGITQENTAAITFDNYALYAVDTVHGPGILVYDTMTETFVSLDLYPGLSNIKQFAAIKIQGENRLFFITIDNKLYEAYAGTVSPCRIYIGDIITGDDKSEHRVSEVHATFLRITTAGLLKASVYVDRKFQASIYKNVEQLAVSDTEVPDDLPYTEESEDVIRTIPFNFKSTTKGGHGVGIWLEWDFEAFLTSVSIITETDRQMSNTQEVGINRGTFFVNGRSVTDTYEVKCCVVGDDGVVSQDHANVARAIKDEEPDYILGVGDHIYSTDIVTSMINYWASHKEICFFAAGNHDLDLNNGTNFFQYWNQPYNNQRYFAVTLLPGVLDIFIMNSGLNTALVNKEPDGYDPTSLQALWFKAQLALSTARFKLMLGHRPPYTSDTNYYPGDANYAWPYKSWGASAAIFGHAHDYEHIYRDGFHYFINGIGGRSLRTFNASPVVGSVKRYNSKYGYMVIYTDKFRMKLQCKSWDGDIIDSVVIQY